MKQKTFIQLKPHPFKKMKKKKNLNQRPLPWQNRNRPNWKKKILHGSKGFCPFTFVLPLFKKIPGKFPQEFYKISVPLP